MGLVFPQCPALDAVMWKWDHNLLTSYNRLITSYFFQLYIDIYTHITFYFFSVGSLAQIFYTSSPWKNKLCEMLGKYSDLKHRLRSILLCSSYIAWITNNLESVCCGLILKIVNCVEEDWDTSCLLSELLCVFVFCMVSCFRALD